MWDSFHRMSWNMNPEMNSFHIQLAKFALNHCYINYVGNTVLKKQLNIILCPTFQMHMCTHEKASVCHTHTHTHTHTHIHWAGKTFKEIVFRNTAGVINCWEFRNPNKPLHSRQLCCGLLQKKKKNSMWRRDCTCLCLDNHVITCFNQAVYIHNVTSVFSQLVFNCTGKRHILLLH